MKYVNNIFLSTTCFNNNSLESIKISIENGIFNLEISGGLQYIDENKLEKYLKKTQKKF